MGRGRWIALLLLGLAFAQAAGEYAVSGRVVYEARGPIGAFEGENRKVGGALVWDAASGEASGRICVDLSAWDSGEWLRDKHIRTMFEADVYPEACFELVGTTLHWEKAGKPAGAAYTAARYDDDEGEDGEAAPPPLAPLGLTGLAVLGAVTLYVRDEGAEEA